MIHADRGAKEDLPRPLHMQAIMSQGHRLPASHCGALRSGKPCGNPTTLWLPVILTDHEFKEIVTFMPVCDGCQLDGFLIALKDHHAAMVRLKGAHREYWALKEEDSE